MSEAGNAKREEVSEPLANNVEALMRRREREAEQEIITERIAARMADFTGSVWSVLVHGVIFGLWILINVGLLPIFEPWDPTLVVLAMIASVEAIFLSTFVLMNQRRQARLDEDRAELTLQISLLAEHETTKLASLLMAIAERLEVDVPEDVDAEDLTKTVSPEGVLEEIRRKRRD
ncbi:membrane protein [Nitratireductor aestuarii]|uniref:Membrane protein n=1 Tax=Nitratireductor aestuarii TaxID=1735103 RepID=A0A916RV67_9HYPH|nr:DUF1003 domain-containing protein [Nitratireductor aestuarii]GGA72181.1 membrane protein [Nitratireductor aestuarii]